MTAHNADKADGPTCRDVLWMPERDASALPTHSRNGRPMDSHERGCQREPVIDNGHEDCEDLGTVCLVCGCCFGCGDDCCAEWFCPNPVCGCSRAMQMGADRG